MAALDLALAPDKRLGRLVVAGDELLDQRPQLAGGNTSNAALRVILKESLPKALELVGKGEPVVEISGMG